MSDSMEQKNSFCVLKNDDGSNWSPVMIPELSSVIDIPMIKRNNAYTTCKNIAYNLQYIQYLQKQLDSVYLTDVLERMVCKNYIITAMSIIEAIFAYLVKDSGNWKASEWKSIHKIRIDNQKPFELEGRTLKVQVEVFEKVDAQIDELQFDAIIDKVRSKKLMKFKTAEAFDFLKKFKSIRNKIHLHITQDATDYKIFDKKLQVQMKYILSAVLKNEAICKNASKAGEVYSFLDLSVHERGMVGLQK